MDLSGAETGSRCREAAAAVVGLLCSAHITIVLGRIERREMVVSDRSWKWLSDLKCSVGMLDYVLR